MVALFKKPGWVYNVGIPKEISLWSDSSETSNPSSQRREGSRGGILPPWRLDIQNWASFEFEKTEHDIAVQNEFVGFPIKIPQIAQFTLLDAQPLGLEDGAYLGR